MQGHVFCWNSVWSVAIDRRDIFASLVLNSFLRMSFSRIVYIRFIAWAAWKVKTCSAKENIFIRSELSKFCSRTSFYHCTCSVEHVCRFCKLDSCIRIRWLYLFNYWYMISWLHLEDIFFKKVVAGKWKIWRSYSIVANDVHKLSENKSWFIHGVKADQRLRVGMEKFYQEQI